jgi:hypothetical protein
MPAVTGRFFPGDEGHGPRQRDGYLVTPKLSLSCPMHAGKKPTSVQKMSPPDVKQAAYGETRTAIIKKKLMKNKILIEAAAPANAVQPSSGKLRAFNQHQANRRLPTDTVLNCLRTQLPRQYEVAEVVGKWVWLDVSPARKPMLAKVLWSLGFHWNQRRGVWQHPCGRFDPLGSHPTDPRTKYHCYFPADVQPA